MYKLLVGIEHQIDVITTVTTRRIVVAAEALTFDVIVDTLGRL